VLFRSKSPNLVWWDIKQSIDRLSKNLVVFVLGGPGSGKGTQCAKISKKYGYTHLSAGDLLREERNSGSPLATMINEFIVQGKIVPAEVTINLLKNAMTTSGNKKFLIDGFPRNMENMEAWYTIMEATCTVDFVLFFDCPEDVMRERLLERGKTSGRNDDNVATIIKRFQTFQIESVPVMKALQRIGKVRIISAVPPPDVVFKYVSRLFDALALVPTFQRTIGIIKPDAVENGCTPAVMEAIANANLCVLATKYVLMTPNVVSGLYPELAQAGPAHFNAVRDLMTSGPSLVLLLEGTDAVKRWSNLIGPENPADAKVSNPDSLRAKFGGTAVRNACHASLTEKAAISEIAFFMDPKSPGAAVEVERVVTGSDDPVGIPVESTLSMIKPCSSETSYEEIVAILALHGFEIASELKTTLSNELACSFYAEHKGKPFFDGLKSFMTSGPVVAIKLRRHGAIKGYRHLMGFTNTLRAKLERPDSIRALYGTDGTRNAVHGSDSTASAAKELSFFFNIGGGASAESGPATELIGQQGKVTQPPGQSQSSTAAAASPKTEESFAKAARARRAKLEKSVPASKRAELSLFLEDTIDPILRGLVERILVKKPKDVIGFAIQDLQEVQRLTIGAMAARSAVKLEPLPAINKGAPLAPIAPSQAHMAPISSKDVDRRELFLVHFNDIYDYEEDKKHGHGGAARCAWKIKDMCTSEENPLILHSGDFLSPSNTSNETKGRHMVDIMNLIGVHYGVPGNHDFDFGIDNLAQQLAASNAVWICSNLVNPDTLKPVAGCVKDVIVQRNGVSVGIMGLCENWLSLCPHISSSEVLYLDIFETARKCFGDLRRRGAEVVIALTHCRNVVDIELSRRVPELDIVLGGHEHEYYAWKLDDSTYGVKSGCDFRDLTKIRISLKKGTERPKVHYPFVRVGITKDIPEDPAVKEVVEYWVKHMSAQMNVPIAYTTQLLDGRGLTVRTRESNLGNMISDIMRAYYKADIAILNGGFIRSDDVLEAGLVTMGDMARFFPFPDLLTKVELTGLEVLRCLENGISRAPALDGRFCQVSGITMTYGASLERPRVKRVMINGVKLEPDRTYTMACNGFMGGGNEGYKVLKDKTWLVDEEHCPQFYAVIVQYLKGTILPNYSPTEPTPDMFKHLSPVVEGRITVAAENDSYNIYSDLSIPMEKFRQQSICM